MTGTGAGHWWRRYDRVLELCANMDYEVLNRLTRDSLEHLNDRPYLATHPLALLLAGDAGPAAGERFRRFLLDAIEQVRPIGTTGSHHARWRQYQHVVLRYVEEKTRDEIAGILGVSPRQASRDHEQAIDAICRVLWLWLRRDDPEIANSIPDRGKLGGSILAAPDSVGEITRATAREETTAILGKVLAGVLSTVESFMVSHDVSFSLAVPDTLPAIAMPPTLLRQALLNLLMYAAETVPGSLLRLTAADTPRGVVLTVEPRSIESPVAGTYSRGLPRCAPPSEVAIELLCAGRQLLEIQGGVANVLVGDSCEPLLTIVLPPVALRKILVIDDNPDVVGLFRRYLRDQPYRLIQATSGQSALRLIQQLLPEVIILDVLLPSMDGWDVLHLIREQEATRKVPVIVCSILPERALALSAGARVFLPKPVTRTSLLDALQAVTRDESV